MQADMVVTTTSITAVNVSNRKLQLTTKSPEVIQFNKWKFWVSVLPKNLKNINQDKIAEITGLEQRIQTFQQNAQQSLQAKEQELLEPILSKARKAIEDIAKEGDFTYIFDKSIGSILYAKESEDIMSLVKKKLGM